MTASRARCILVGLARANRERLVAWYAEVYGALPGEGLTTDRLRESIREALVEGLAP